MESRKDQILSENGLSIDEMRQTETFRLLENLKDKKVPRNVAFTKAFKCETCSSDNLETGQFGMIHRYVYDGLCEGSYISPNEIDLANELNLSQDFFARYYSLLKHRGFRKGCLHTLVGFSGHGKSSLLRTWILDAASTGKVLVLLTEEDIKQYQIELNLICEEVY